MAQIASQSLSRIQSSWIPCWARVWQHSWNTHETLLKYLSSKGSNAPNFKSSPTWIKLVLVFSWHSSSHLISFFLINIIIQHDKDELGSLVHAFWTPFQHWLGRNDGETKKLHIKRLWPTWCLLQIISKTLTAAAMPRDGWLDCTKLLQGWQYLLSDR